MTSLAVSAPLPGVLQSRFGERIWQVLLLVSIWIWAIWSCAEHWRGNPNYSYGWAVPPLAIGFGLRRFWRLRGDRFSPVLLPGGAVAVAILLGFLGLGLEYARVAMWHPEIVLWSICLLCVCLTLLVFRLWSPSLFREELFPVLFFLTAVPWPPRIEQPLTAALMRSVASATVELLHWLGIEATVSGGAIALQSGLVGITEACSGIRSLQAGIMFGLAMGEWFLLRPSRRMWLLLLAVVLALLSNLGRTLTLALQAEWYGGAAVERIHDFAGNVAVTALVLAIALGAKLLAGRKRSPIDSGQDASVSQDPSGLTSGRTWIWPLAAVALLAGIFSARLVYARGEGNGYVQLAPRFVPRADDSSGNKLLSVPSEVWNELRPTSGEYVRRVEPPAGSGSVDFFHFFWKPSVWNRFALVHRPDVCMPGIGWTARGSAEPVTVLFNGHPVQFYLFHFQRGDTHAIEVWGAWRNAEPVPIDYSIEQVFGTVATPVFLHGGGKRRSATEILACSVLRSGEEPSREIAVALLPAVFDYKEQ